MMQMVNEQLGRHNLPADNVPRNLLKFLTSAVGLPEVRLFVAQKIESWIQNPKVSIASAFVVCIIASSYCVVTVTVILSLSLTLLLSLSPSLFYSLLTCSLSLFSFPSPLSPPPSLPLPPSCLSLPPACQAVSRPSDDSGSK